MKVMVVEDQALVRGAISALLGLEPNIEVVAQAVDGVDAIEKLSKYQVDIVLTDIEMPNKTGLELAQYINEQLPTVLSVIMTTFSKAGYIQRAMDLNVKGFILKEAPVSYLVNALEEVMRGKKVIEPELLALGAGERDPLTDKERTALRLAGEGMTTKEIAVRLYLSDGTVRNYLSEAIAKLYASNRIDAARIAKQKGWL
ncbi:Transcriptional regulatory protein DesR [Pseudoalteromonas sp. CIP111854]|uniref:Transcriptional regulatory protein DesR n=1 Tax=Pseudoalteromonas holothuriae TaxID=2963714 RepID=A0A9W4QVA7_9GAMM|nr:response regulator transcription factor [Pseudoalteromonas sp. CIP111854]CAH9054681.1 Transcriptional regulatory protein DesR [Pseudoalteromonas sp. CIP111854]